MLHASSGYSRPVVHSGKYIRSQQSLKVEPVTRTGTRVAHKCYCWRSWVWRDMTKVITLRKTGGSVSATLPKTMAERMNVSAGDKVFLVETDRGILLTPYDPEFQDAVDAFEHVRRQYRNTLKKLAE